MPRPILLTYAGEAHSLREWARQRGIGQSTLQYRKRCGWTDAEILGFESHRRNGGTPPPPVVVRKREQQPWCPHATHGVPLRSLQLAQAYATVFGCTGTLALVYSPCVRCKEAQ